MNNFFGWMILMAALLLPERCSPYLAETAKLPAIRAEALALMKAHPPGAASGWRRVPEREWPPAIAALKPEFVTGDGQSISIVVKAFFDGGWGYEIPRDPHHVPDPVSCSIQPAPGVYWHGPC